MQKEKRLPTGRRKNITLAVLFLLLLGVFLLSFCIGRYAVPLREVAGILLSWIFAPGTPWPETSATVVLNIRLPRILLACLVGAGLSGAGCAYQSVFRNPLASPDILGASAGAAFGAALAIYLGGARFAVICSSFAFSALTVVLVFMIGSRAQGKGVLNLILAGIMVSALFTSGTSYIKLVADPTNKLPVITYWLMGALSGAKQRDVAFAAIPIAAGLIPLMILRWRLNILTLGDDEARAMGINPARTRVVAVLGATLVTAGSVSVSGMIGWVGLVIPHLCRRLVGNDNRTLLPASLLCGASFLLVVDNISRNLLATEIPIGILMSFIGAPFFIYLMFTGEGGA